jgi:hypothetical protein
VSDRGGAPQDLRRAATWGFWSGTGALTVYYTLALILRRGFRPPDLWLETGIAFVAGAALGAWLFLHLRRLERDAQSRTT